MDIDKIPCHICGAVNYEIGIVEHYHPQAALNTLAYTLRFRREGQTKPSWGLLEMLRSDKPKTVNRARHCLDCGNVQLFMEL